MKIKTFSEMELRIAADDLAALLYRAKQGEIQFAENEANKKKLCNLKKEYTELKALYLEKRKEVIEMPVKWSRGRAQRPAPHDSQKPKAKKPKAAKPPKGEQKPKGEKEAK